MKTPCDFVEDEIERDNDQALRGIIPFVAVLSILALATVSLMGAA